MITARPTLIALLALCATMLLALPGVAAANPGAEAEPVTPDESSVPVETTPVETTPVETTPVDTSTPVETPSEPTCEDTSSCSPPEEPSCEDTSSCEPPTCEELNNCEPEEPNCTNTPSLPECNEEENCTTNPELPECTEDENCTTNPELPECDVDEPPFCERNPTDDDCKPVLPSFQPPSTRAGGTAELPFTGPGDAFLAIMIAFVALTGGSVLFMTASGREALAGLRRRTMRSSSGFRDVQSELRDEEK